jgi:hypothetical protein
MGVERVQKQQQDGFDVAISRCRQAFDAFQQLAARTDEALYRALGEIYTLLVRLRTDAALRDEFDRLLQQPASGRPLNEALLLVKYAFFPHTVTAGPGHKSDITKASRYAKLINRALEQDIRPADFLAFAQDHGIQRTAATSRQAKPFRFGKRQPHRRQRPSASPSLAGAALFATTILMPLELWFYSNDGSAQLRHLLRAAKHQAQRISLTVYVSDDRAALTECTGQPWTGEFPEAATTVALEPRSAATFQANTPRLLPRRSGLPVRIRGRALSRLRA